MHLFFNTKRHRFSECFCRYFDDVDAHTRLARSSLEKYREIVPRIIEILGDVDVRKLNDDSITFLKKTMNSQGLSSPRKNGYLVVLRNMLRFISTKEKTRVYDFRRIERFREPRKKVEFLTKNELHRLLNSIDESAGITKLRLKTAVICLFSTGCRVSELLSLNRSDINFQTGIVELSTKGGKIQKKIFNRIALEYLDKYLKARGDSNEALFATRYSDFPKRWQINDFERALRNCGRKIDLKVTPHSLRRTAATIMFHSGVSLSVVQQFLGHSSPQVTERHYLGDSNFSEVENAHKKVMNLDF